ncbi:hypothetical protein THC_0391 [Caldimicrobium thiodismutans]|uniref:Lipoprotein n=1 Tax=Caldimicrobium thiodismutans TaxID=1653476 RepID=A0A0U5AFK2_9BACT|nr:hypothetical protein [Caldimicrobium thiodismutans]BAU22787.1 hypothetical protein THC_0391 [Caldimicrobium thiodismutans]
MSLKRFIIFFLFFLLTSCAYKEVQVPSVYLTLATEGFQGRTLKGRVFFQGELFFLNDNNSSGGSYGTFYTTADELILILTPPLSTEIFIYWKRGEEVRVLNTSKKKVYTIKIKELRDIDFPSYFLGLKERERSFKKGFFSGEYRFSDKDLQGTLESNLLKLNWKIKEIAFTEETLPRPDWKDFKEKDIKLIF